MWLEPYLLVAVAAADHISTVPDYLHCNRNGIVLLTAFTTVILVTGGQ